MAASTWLCATLPDEQAEPEETATPARSSAISRISAESPATAKHTVCGSRGASLANMVADLPIFEAPAVTISASRSRHAVHSAALPVSASAAFAAAPNPAIAATFNGPKGIAWSASDQSLYVVDTENHAIRRVDLRSGVISTVIGTGQRADGPDGDPLKCGMARPHGVVVFQGTLYVTDSENHRIRAIEI